MPDTQERRPIKTNDPQIVLDYEIKAKSPDSPELIVFTIPLGFFQLVCICPLAEEGQNYGKVYVKFKVGWTNNLPVPVRKPSGNYASRRGPRPDVEYVQTDRNGTEDR